MTTFICFVIAMTIVYLMKLLDGGFDLKELLAFILMVALLGSHVYLSAGKRAVYGLAVPAVIVISFFPVYKMTAPSGDELAFLILGYFIAVIGCVFIWYRVRKGNREDGL